MSDEPKIVSGDEHPSGLRDATLEDVIFRAVRTRLPADIGPWTTVAEYIHSEVSAWLSVVSEEEIEAAAIAMSEPMASAQHMRRKAAAALAASREVLIPAIESDASVIVGPSKEETR